MVKTPHVSGVWDKQPKIYAWILHRIKHEKQNDGICMHEKFQEKLINVLLILKRLLMKPDMSD